MARAMSTLVLLKPECVQRFKMGEVLSVFEDAGLQVVGVKMVKPSRELVEAHYAEHAGKSFYEVLISRFQDDLGTPVVAIALTGPEVVGRVRTLLGRTNPAESSPGTIRGSHALTTGRNFVHASDSETSAQRELDLWFPEGLVDYTLALAPYL